MLYEPDYIALREAASRLEHAGHATSEVRLSIFSAIRDGKLRIRAHRHSEPNSSSPTYGRVEQHLIRELATEADFDWETSRLQAIEVPMERYFQVQHLYSNQVIGPWSKPQLPPERLAIDLLEIFRQDFEELFPFISSPGTANYEKQIPVPVRETRQGRPIGLSYASADAPLVEEMKRLIESDETLSRTAAARRVVIKAKGTSEESKVRRLLLRFAKTYSEKN